MYSSFLYRKLPRLFQEILISARFYTMEKIKESGRFASYREKVNLSQWLSPIEMESLKNDKLSTLLTALKSTPYYQPLVDDIQILDVRSLKKLPFIDKQIVRAAIDDFINLDFSGAQTSGRTSGTTGAPLALHKSYEELRWEAAYVARQLEWAGYTAGEKRVWLRGDMIVAGMQSEPPFWRMNYTDNMLMMSSYHLSARNADSYISRLGDFDPVLIQAYPSSIVFLAKYLEQTSQYYQGASLEGIMTSSESFSPMEKILVRDRFCCKIFDWYGCYERVAAIATCEYERYHLLDDYSHVELLPDDNGRYQIVGTNYNNLLMPLVRYKTGDFVRVEEPDVQCKCGRKFPLIKEIYGRDDDSIITPNGRFINRLDHIFKHAKGVVEAQIVQTDIRHVRILVVPTENYSSAVSEKILAEFQQRVGGELLASIEVVDAIQRTSNGKFKSVICEIGQA